MISYKIIFRFYESFSTKILLYSFFSLQFIWFIKGVKFSFKIRKHHIKDDLIDIYKLKTGGMQNKDAFWLYSGVIRSATTGNSVASIVGIERLTSTKCNTTDFKLAYLSDKAFIFTELG